MTETMLLDARSAGVRVGIFALVAAMALPGAAAAAEWNGYAALSTDDMFRGVSLLDTGFSVQGNLEGRFDDGLIAGAWVAKVDRQWLYQSRVPEHAEVDVYGGLDVSCGSICRARVIVTGYFYPGPSARNWAEVTTSVSLAERVGASVSWSPQGLGSTKASHTVDGWLVQPLSRDLSFEFDYGVVWLGPHDYWFARAGLSQRWRRFVFDISEYWSDPTLQRFGLDDHSRRLVASIRTAF